MTLHHVTVYHRQSTNSERKVLSAFEASSKYLSQLVFMHEESKGTGEKMRPLTWRPSSSPPFPPVTPPHPPTWWICSSFLSLSHLNPVKVFHPVHLSPHSSAAALTEPFHPGFHGHAHVLCMIYVGCVLQVPSRRPGSPVETRLKVHPKTKSGALSRSSNIHMEWLVTSNEDDDDVCAHVRGVVSHPTHVTTEPVRLPGILQ